MLFNKRKSFTPLVVSSMFVAAHCITVMAVQTGVVHTYDLNIRKTTSINSEVLGVAKKGSSVDIISKENDFYKIKHNGIEGYVSCEYITVNENVKNSQEKVLKYGKVNLHGLQVRSEASDKGKLITLLEKDTLLEIYETKGVWHRIKVDGNNAWVYMGYVSDIKKPETSVPQLVSKKYGKVNYEGLQVRSSATDNSELVTVLQKDTLLEIEEMNNLWYKIKVDGKDAWVYMGYVDLISKPTSTIPSIESKKYGQVNYEGLQVRSSASDSSTLITTLPKNTLLEIEGFNGVWYKIKVDGKDAWVYMGYVNLISKPTSTIPPITTLGKVIDQGKVINVASNDTLNIRSGPSSSYDKLGEVPAAGKVDIYEIKNNWYKIKYNGIIGWVSGYYIEIIVPTVINTGTIHTYDVNARVEANYNATVLGVIKKGSTVDIYETKNNWHKIKYDGKEGWVSGKYVDPYVESNNSQSTYGYVSTNIAPIRSSKSTDTFNSNVLYKVKENTKVEILEKDSVWTKVKYNNKVGYMRTDHLNKDAQSRLRDAVVSYAKEQLGKPYVYGAYGPNTFDCSGLVTYVYNEYLGFSLDRTSNDQSKTSGELVSRNDLLPGDLLFFDPNKDGVVSHVGIYIGDGKMIHAPKPGEVVKIISIDVDYYQKGFHNARRVI